MPTLQPLLHYLQDTPFATAIREGDTLFPWIECVHVLAITFVVGSIAAVDLRLLGLASRDRRFSRERRRRKQKGRGLLRGPWAL